MLNDMQYRKKPIVIDAVQITKDMVLDHNLPEGTALCSSSTHPKRREVHNFTGAVETLEGTMYFGIGDYIITGVNGEKYPCKPDIFEKTYDLVE